MAKKKSKSEAIEDVLKVASGYQRCVVDINNKFYYNGYGYVIDESVKQYVVLNKPKKVGNVMNDWTNEAAMSTILVVDSGDELRFFDENLVEVSSEKVIPSK